MCILYCKKCQSAEFENAVVAVAVELLLVDIAEWVQTGVSWLL